MAVIKEIKDKEYKPVIESDSDSESPVISAPTADIPTALHPRHHQDKDSLRQRKGQDSLEKIFKKEDEQKKKQLFKGNAAVMILVVVFLLSCCIPIIEMLTKTYKPAPRPKSNSSGPKNHYTPPEYGNYDSPEPKPDRVVKKAYDLYRVKDLKKLKIKDLKTILWGRRYVFLLKSVLRMMICEKKRILSIR